MGSRKSQSQPISKEKRLEGHEQQAAWLTREPALEIRSPNYNQLLSYFTYAKFLCYYSEV